MKRSLARRRSRWYSKVVLPFASDFNGQSLLLLYRYFACIDVSSLYSSFVPPWIATALMKCVVEIHQIASSITDRVIVQVGSSDLYKSVCVSMQTEGVTDVCKRDDEICNGVSCFAIHRSSSRPCKSFGESFERTRKDFSFWWFYRWSSCRRKNGEFAIYLPTPCIFVYTDGKSVMSFKSYETF